MTKKKGFCTHLSSFRLNMSKIEFKEFGDLSLELLKRASQAGLTSADFNYPEHLFKLETENVKGC